MKMIHRIWVEWARWQNYQLAIVGLLLGAIIELAVLLVQWHESSLFWHTQYIQHFPLTKP